MKLLVTQIEFDFDDCYDEELSKDEQLSYTQDALGIWEVDNEDELVDKISDCLLYTSPSPRDVEECRMPSSA